MRWSSKNFLVRVAQPNVFLDKKTTNIWVDEWKNSNINFFENFRIISREKAAANRIIHRCIINSRIHWELHGLDQLFVETEP